MRAIRGFEGAATACSCSGVSVFDLVTDECTVQLLGVRIESVGFTELPAGSRDEAAVERMRGMRA